MLGQARRHGLIVPIEAHGPANGAGSGVDEAGCAHADPDQGPIGSLHQVEHQRLERAQGSRAVVVPDVARLPGVHLTAQVDDDAAEAVTIDIDADELAGVSRDAQQDGRLAAGRRTRPGLDHEPVVEQPFDQVGDGRAGQLRGAGDIRPAERAILVDGAQDKTFVGAPGATVGGLDESGYGHVPHLSAGCQR